MFDFDCNAIPRWKYILSVRSNDLTLFRALTYWRRAVTTDILEACCDYTVLCFCIHPNSIFMFVAYCVLIS